MGNFWENSELKREDVEKNIADINQITKSLIYMDKYKIHLKFELDDVPIQKMNRKIIKVKIYNYDEKKKEISNKLNSLHIAIEDFYKYYNLLMNLRRVFLNEQMEKNINNLSTSQIKKLGEDKIFKFECTIESENLKLSLKEVNSYSPYYYEVYYTKEELCQMKGVFKSFEELEVIQSNIEKLFALKATTLESLEDDSKIKIHIESMVLADPVELDFILDRKTVENVDEALYFLYKLEKNKYNIIEKIKSICQEKNNKNEKIAEKILETLNKKFENYYN